MKYQHDGYNWLVRLQKGEKLIESLTKLAKEENLPSCWLNAIGAASSVELGYYNLEKQEYQWHELNELMEITGLQGNLTFNRDQPNFHLHGTFSKRDLSVVGGHVKDLVVAGTCEVLLHKWYADKLTRSKDDEVGLNLLNL